MTDGTTPRNPASGTGPNRNPAAGIPAAPGPAGRPRRRKRGSAIGSLLRSGAVVLPALAAFSGRPALHPGEVPPSAGAPPTGTVTGRAASTNQADDSFEPVERGRDPLGLVRSAARPRIWILFDTSTSMNESVAGGRKLELAREAVAHAVRHLESDGGEPLAHWRLAVFGPYIWIYELDDPNVRSCRDPTKGAGVPRGSASGLRVWRQGPCPGLLLRSAVAGCDAETAQREVLAALPRYAATQVTPNGIALLQLAGHIRETALDDLQPGQQNIILLVTDGVDTCECDSHAWADFNEGRTGKHHRLLLLGKDTEPTPSPRGRYTRFEFGGINAGLKAKAAFLAINDGDPDAGLGDIHVIGFTDGRRRYREITNHLGWMASNLRRPAYHATRPEALAEALGDVLRRVTLPEGVVKLGAPVLATVKELVAGSPTPAFPGTDPALAREALVGDPTDARRFEETLRRRGGYADNVLLSTSADLTRLRGHLRAHPVFGGGTGTPATPDRTGPTVIWDAGERLARRDPDDRLILYNRPGETRLRRFEVGVVTPSELGVWHGFLRDLDGRGARTAEDAAELVVRIVRGERIAVHPTTGTIYDEDGELHFTGGVGSWKLRESLAAPAVAPSPPRHPEGVARHRKAYREFFETRVNRRTVVYLPTNGGLLHAFAADTGEELFAYIPDDLLGPGPGETYWETRRVRTMLRDLAAGYALLTPERQVGLAGRYTLAGSPVVRDLYLPEAGKWATVLAFGREYGGRFLTALDVSAVGGEWDGTAAASRPGAGGEGLPRLLFNLGNRLSDLEGVLEGLGETPAPLLVETPRSGGGSEWTAFLSGGVGSASDDSGEWLFEIEPESGRVRQRYRLAPGAAPRIPKNGAPTAPAPWRPVWAQPGAGDLVTRLYLGDLHGQVHRLALDGPGPRSLEVAFRLGGERPIATRPVAFPFPGRSEPHLLVVGGGDRRVRGERSVLVLLRETAGRLREVWRRELPEGESPQGNPAVRVGNGTVEVLLVTKSADREESNCGETVTSRGVSRLRAFHGLTGAPAPGALGGSGASIAYGPSRVRGLSVSASGNLALGVSQVAGAVFDTVIGDFRFKVREGALAEITFFVEGLRRSPF